MIRLNIIHENAFLFDTFYLFNKNIQSHFEEYDDIDFGWLVKVYNWFTKTKTMVLKTSISNNSTANKLCESFMDIFKPIIWISFSSWFMKLFKQMWDHLNKAIHFFLSVNFVELSWIEFRNHSNYLFCCEMLIIKIRQNK